MWPTTSILHYTLETRPFTGGSELMSRGVTRGNKTVISQVISQVISPCLLCFNPSCAKQKPSRSWQPERPSWMPCQQGNRGCAGRTLFGLTWTLSRLGCVYDWRRRGCPDATELRFVPLSRPPECSPFIVAEGRWLAAFSGGLVSRD